jgi:PEGA domain
MRNCFFSLLSLALCPLLVAQQATGASSSQPASSATAITPAGPPQPHTLLDGTPVKLRLSQTISSANAKVGQEIPFEVVEEIKVDDAVVLPKGAVAIGTVTECNPKKSMGRAGKLNLNISYARLADQEKVALRATQDNKGGGHVGAMTGAMVATAVVFFPAAPLFLFIKGKDITIPQGTEITAFIEGDMHLNMANFGVALPAVAAPPQVAQASLVIDSTPPGADIEIDGAFVGNTPSTIPVANGSHEITVQKKGFSDWTRKLSVTGGSIHLSAALDAASAPTETPAGPPVPSPASAPPSVPPVPPTATASPAVAPPS